MRAKLRTANAPRIVVISRSNRELAKLEIPHIARKYELRLQRKKAQDIAQPSRALVCRVRHECPRTPVWQLSRCVRSLAV